MEKKSKVVVIVAIIVALVVLLSVGVALAATGVISGLFKSDKQKAFDMLKQAPDRLVETAIGDATGQQQLYENVVDNGLDMDLKISNLSMSSLNSIDLSGYTLGIGAQVDFDTRKMATDVSLDKNEKTLSAQVYGSLDEKKIALAVPELIENKTFSMTLEDDETEETLNQIQTLLNLFPELKESFTQYIEDQGDDLYEQTTCEEIDGGYRLTIPKAAMDQVLTEFTDYLNTEQEKINTIEETLGLTTGTIYSSVNTAIPSITAYTKDFTFQVYGSDDEITGISGTYDIEGQGQISIDISFTTEGEKKNTSLTVDVLEDGSSVGKITYSLESESGDVCTDHMSLAFTVEDSTVFSMTEDQSLDLTNNNAYTLSGTTETLDLTQATISATGNIKNLEVGKCMTTVYDEVTTTVTDALSSANPETISYSMEFTVSVLDGEIGMPTGEEVAVTPDTLETELTQYMTDMQTKLSEYVTAWDLTSLLTTAY